MVDSLSGTSDLTAPDSPAGQPRAGIMPSRAPLLRLTGIVKRFPGVTALDEVDFDLQPGEVHVLFGENGSGKSTLIKVIAGVYPWNKGVYALGRQEIARFNPQQAIAAGISSVFQEFSLAPNLTVAQNIFLGREQTKRGFLQSRAMQSTVLNVLKDLGFSLASTTRVSQLSRADRQMTEIAKALMSEAKILIFDEPTASLTEKETRRLFDIIQVLRKKGVGIIYVSHRLAEIREIADRITILRDGRRVATVAGDQVSDIQLVEMMTGRKIGMLYPIIDHSPGETVLEVRNLSVEGRLEKVNIHLREGEITGLAGLAGHGKSAIARAIYGLERISEGEVVLAGEVIPRPAPSKMLSKGVFYCPSDRQTEGLGLPRPVRENASVSALDLPKFSRYKVLRLKCEKREIREVAEVFQIRPSNIEMPVEFLSGGNQQKVVLCRGLIRNSKVFLFDDPTVGVDVGAKKEIYLFLKQLVEHQRAAVLFISSELPELLNLSNRLYVTHRGRIVAELKGVDIAERNVLRAFFAEG